MLQRNCGFKTKLNIVWPSDFSPSYHVWAAELGTTRVFAHAWHMTSRTRIVAAVSKYGEHAWDYVIVSWRHNLGSPFCISCSRNVQCSMNVEDCVFSKICNGNSIMVNTVTLENYKVNRWDIWLLCNIDGTGPLCLARPTLYSNFDQCDRIFFIPLVIVSHRSMSIMRNFWYAIQNDGIIFPIRHQNRQRIK